MKKAGRIVSLFSAAAMLLSSAGITAFAEQDSSAKEKAVSEMIAEMTVQQKIEQMVMITLRPWIQNGSSNVNVTTLNDAQKKLIQEHNFNGVCLFAPNIHDTAQTVALNNEIQQAAMDSECGIPMMIAADQEGGSIYRLTTGTPTCGNMALGAANDPELARKNAEIIGSELKAVGINTNFAPVLDVNCNPSNPVINIRSFSSDADIVSSLGAGYIAGLKDEGVITTSKHFPGHGDTNVDSHTGLPLIDKTYDELKKTELAPYAVNALNSDMVMTAHIQFPEIETQTYISKLDGKPIMLPATLSKKVITDILRNDYKFSGVVITDSMVMNAIASHFDPVDAAVLAINAGVDIILEPMTINTEKSIAELEKYIEAITEKVTDGTIKEKTVNDAVTRILTLKKQRGILDFTPADAEKALKIVGCDEHRETALEVAEKAVTLVKNDNDLLPLDLGADGKAAYFYPYDNVKNTMEFALTRLKKDGTISENVSAVCNCYQGHKASEYEETVKDCDAVIVSLEMYRAANIDKNDPRGWQAVFCDDMIELAHKNGKKVIYISANIPYDVARFTAADAIVAVYNANGMAELPVDGKENTAYGVNYPAGLITIFGGSAPTGKLPVDAFAVDEGSHYTDKILFPCGFGMNYEPFIRAAGTNRYGTAAETAKKAYPDGTQTVVLANAQTFADALAGAALADKLDAPILLTAKDSIPRETTNAIEKLGAKKAVILGGTGAVSVQVESILRDNDITTERIAGATRFGTAAEIAKRVNDKPAEVFFVYAGDYPDALSVSTVAARKNAPVLYLPTNGRIDAATQQYLDSVKGSVKNAYVIGGDGVISDAVMQNAADATGLKTNETLTRVAGRNRYLTNLAVNYTFADVLTSNSICTATGKDFPDALAGGVLAAQKGAPILLVSDDLIKEQSDYLAKRAAIKVYVHGGTAAVSDELAHKIAKAA